MKIWPFPPPAPKIADPHPAPPQAAALAPSSGPSSGTGSGLLPDTGSGTQSGTQSGTWSDLGRTAALVIGTTGVVLGLQFLGALRSAEWMLLDAAFNLRPPEAGASRVVLVTVDELT
jgi:hypothetical protein